MSHPVVDHSWYASFSPIPCTLCTSDLECMQHSTWRPSNTMQSNHEENKNNKKTSTMAFNLLGLGFLWYASRSSTRLQGHVTQLWSQPSPRLLWSSSLPLPQNSVGQPIRESAIFPVQKWPTKWFCTFWGAPRMMRHFYSPPRKFLQGWSKIILQLGQ